MKFSTHKIGASNKKFNKKTFFSEWLTAKHKQLESVRKNPRRLYKIIKWFIFTGIIFITGIIFLILVFIVPSLPDVSSIQNLIAAQSSVIYDKDGNLLYTVHGEENREIVKLDKISQHAVKAVLAIEDDQFYSHPGIDIPGVLKAVCAEIGICKARGGSTITQQYIKNAFLSPERTYTRKLREMILAVQLEGKFDKDQILAMYLNRIPYGSSVYGIERASNTLFGKSARDLTIAEGAILAAIPKAPTFYSPYGHNKYASINLDESDILKMGVSSEQELVNISPSLISKGLLGKTYKFGGNKEEKDKKDKGKKAVKKPKKAVKEVKIYIKGRVDFVLGRMRGLKYISDTEYLGAIQEAEKIQFKPFKASIKAPHFVMHVRQLLEEKYGKDQIEKGGLKITTTLDGEMQSAAEAAVEKYAKMNLDKYRANNASLVALDPNNGQVLAMVGSVDYFDDEIDGKVNVALRSRLPGSSFKPIVYAAAFLQGYSPSTILYDVRTKFGAWYEPENYDGKYRGPVSMRQALAHSLNVPAVKSGALAGTMNILDLARKMGIKLNQPNDWYGLSLALGAGEARLLDMVGAYSIFANGGYKMDPVAILKVIDRNGNILEEYQKPKNKTQVLDPQIAYLINNVLSDINARPEGWWRNTLSIPGQINAAKTGTSNKKKGEINFPFDTWTIGYTKRLAAGVWAGNNDGTHLSLKASGLDTAGRIWSHFMTMATKGAKQEAFDKPSKIKFIQVSKKAGKLPSKHTPPKDLKTEVFASFATPTEYDNSYKMVKIDKVSKKLATEYTPEAAIEEKAFFEHHAILPNNANWEDAVRKWAEENNEDDIAPTEYDDVHTAATNKEKPSVIIKTPTNLSIVSPPSVGILVDVSSKSGINYVEYYWDGALIDTSRLSPYKGVINIPKGTKNGSEHTIKAIVYDAVYNTNQSSISVKVDKDTIAPIMKFIYPGDGIGVSVGSSIPIHADAYDTNGDISRVEFYIDGKLKYTDRVTPYIWQFIVPQTPGVYTIHATAYDYANNKTQSTIILNAKEPSPTAQSGNSRIIEPYKNQSFNAGKNILIQVALNKKDRANLKELIVTARKKGKIIKVAETKSSASAYTFIWNKVHAGTYDLQFKTVLKDGKMRFSERVPVVVR